MKSRLRVCRFCKKGLWPWYCNQRIHRKCLPLWRRRYMRDYQRRVRAELKKGWDEVTA